MCTMYASVIIIILFPLKKIFIYTDSREPGEKTPIIKDICSPHKRTGKIIISSRTGSSRSKALDRSFQLSKSAASIAHATSKYIKQNPYLSAMFCKR